MVNVRFRVLTVHHCENGIYIYIYIAFHVKRREEQLVDRTLMNVTIK